MNKQDLNQDFFAGFSYLQLANALANFEHMQFTQLDLAMSVMVPNPDLMDFFKMNSLDELHLRHEAALRKERMQQELQDYEPTLLQFMTEIDQMIIHMRAKGLTTIPTMDDNNNAIYTMTEKATALIQALKMQNMQTTGA